MMGARLTPSRYIESVPPRVRLKPDTTYDTNDNRYIRPHGGRATAGSHDAGNGKRCRVQPRNNRGDQRLHGDGAPRLDADGRGFRNVVT